MEKIFNIKILSFILLFITLFLSIGYSAFNSSLVFEDMVAYIRTESDIRITGINVESATNNGLSQGENYNVSSIKTTFTLPNKTSSITYRIRITNLEAQEMGIYEITGLPDYLTYELENYTLKEKICDKEGRCNLGIIKDDILLTIKYKDTINNPTIINHNINLNFDFRNMYNITYEGITNNGYPTSIIEGDNLEIKFNNAPHNVVVYIDGVKDNSKYTYENGILKVNDVNGDVLVEYKDKVYLATLSTGTYFKESTYLTKIKTISFVDYIDIPSDRLKEYDLSKAGDNSIIGWIDKDYNLYIGSDSNIYATDLTDAFRGMSGVTNIAFNNLNTSENTTLYHTFDGMSNLTTLDVSSFDTSEVTNMSTVFQNCSKITSLDLSNWNTSKVTVMHVMFMGMTNLKNLNISSFDTSNVERMYYMFSDCTSLTTLDLSNFNTKNVKEMQHMFQNMSKLTSLDLSNFDTSKVHTMNRMFQGMTSLINLNISNFDTSNVTEMYAMFSDCTSLTSLDLSSFDTSKVTDMQKMFRNNSKLTTLDLRNANFSNVTSYTDMFLNVQANSNIIVKNSTQQSWIKGKFANLTNVTIAS